MEAPDAAVDPPTRHRNAAGTVFIGPGVGAIEVMGDEVRVQAHAAARGVSAADRRTRMPALVPRSRRVARPIGDARATL